MSIGRDTKKILIFCNKMTLVHLGPSINPHNGSLLGVTKKEQVTVSPKILTCRKGKKVKLREHRLSEGVSATLVITISIQN